MIIASGAASSKPRNLSSALLMRGRDPRKPARARSPFAPGRSPSPLRGAHREGSPSNTGPTCIILFDGPDYTRGITIVIGLVRPEKGKREPLLGLSPVHLIWQFRRVCLKRRRAAEHRGAHPDRA